MSEGALDNAVRVAPKAAGGVGEIRLVPRFRWRAFQLVVDFTTLFAAGMLTYSGYLLSGLGQQDYDPRYYTQLSLAFAAVTLFAMVGFGAYRNQLGLLRIESIRSIVRAVGAGVTLTLTLSFLLKLPAFSRLTLLMLGPVMVLGLVCGRFLFWTLQDRVGRLRRRSKPVLVYGAGETGRLLAQRLLLEHPLGLRPVGFLDDNPRLQDEQVRVGAGVDGTRLPVVGSNDELFEAIERHRAAAVFIAMPSARAERIAELVAQLENHRVPCHFVPSAGELMFSGLHFGQLAGMPLFTRRVQTRDRAHELLQRTLDLVLAIPGLLLAAPLIAVSAVLVRLGSRGPVFFSQTRCGLNGKPFTILKLRTMTADSPRYAQHPSSREDVRITGVGRWLRRLSIDELPQLWNVIRGEMSLVGPRPEMPGVVADYSDIQRQRLGVRPGLTGLWQISADRAFEIHDNIQYDLYYIEHRSLALDIAVLLMTPLVLLGRNGAV